jgi:hypothetical protein
MWCALCACICIPKPHIGLRCTTVLRTLYPSECTDHARCTLTSDVLVHRADAKVEHDAGKTRNEIQNIVRQVGHISSRCQCSQMPCSPVSSLQCMMQQQAAGWLCPGASSIARMQPCSLQLLIADMCLRHLPPAAQRPM